MARYAIISGSEVANVVEWDGNVATWQPPAGAVAQLVPDGVRVGSGDTWDGAQFVAPPPPPLSRREELAAKSSLTASEIQEALRLLLRQ